MREEIGMLGNVGCEEMDWEHIYEQELLENSIEDQVEDDQLD